MGTQEIEVWTSGHGRIKNAGRVPAFFLEMPYPPARAMIEEGLSAARAALMEVIRAGWVNLKVKELPATYRLYYKTATDAKVSADITDGRIVGRWKMKFREPKPGLTTE